MKTTVCALLLLLAGVVSTPLAAIGNLSSYRSLGTTYCTTYLQDYENALAEDGTLDRTSGRFAAHAGFILGYFSAFNAWAQNDIVDITDGVPFEQLFASTADYCRAHLDNNLIQALEVLVSDLWANRGSRVGKPPWPPGSSSTE